MALNLNYINKENFKYAFYKQYFQPNFLLKVHFYNQQIKKRELESVHSQLCFYLILW